MKRFSPIRWFRNVSIAKKLYFTVGIMATLIAFELGVLVFSIHTLSSVRAYVGGEGLWSKAQKDAMYELQTYGRTHDELRYDSFLNFMKVPNGDHITLMELNKPVPNLDSARQGFIAGRNNPNDVDGMITLFRRFNNISYISKAIEIWKQADSTVRLFLPIGDSLHKEISSGNPSQERINAILQKTDPINQSITELEDQFSFTLGEGSRWLETLILRVLFGVALTVECTGLLIAIFISRSIQKGLNEILLSAQAVGKGDFSRKAKAFSKDEIGILANNFNSMSTELEGSIREIEKARLEFKGLLESAKQLEKEIKEANTNLEKKVQQRTAELASKNKELEQFAYVASHDLQEPLRTTSSFVELLRKQYQGKLDGNADKYIDYVVQASDRMKTLIKDLLDYSRIGREKEYKSVDVNKLVKETISDLDKVLKESHGKVHVGELPVINAFPTELKLLFQNLVSNSIKFRRKGLPPDININAVQDDGQWIFSVSDNGIGIEEQYRQRIFIIFQRLHNRSEYEGSGIGLAHCKKIAELHGGRIWVDSIPGEGSTFFFSISSEVIGS